MNKKTIIKLCGLICFSLQAHNNEQLPFGLEKSNLKLSPDLINIFRQFELYRLTAPWVSKELIKLNLRDFTHAWGWVIDCLTDKEKPYLYFDKTVLNISEFDYWLRVKWQCESYINFFENLYVNTKTNELWYIPISIFINPEEEPLVSYLKFTEKEDLLQLAKLYAFYCDTLSYFFYQSVCSANEQLRSSSQLIHSIIITIHVLLNKIESFTTALSSSKYEVNYLEHCKKYREICRMLEEEFIKAQQGKQ